MQQLNLFTFDQDIGQRLQHIKDEVDNSSADDSAQCNTILEYFHTACDPDSESCSKANQQSFQGTISFDSVCFHSHLI